MKEGYQTGAVIPDFDEQISAFLNQERMEGGGGNMITGIKNNNNDIYRVISTSGMGEYIHLTSFLSSLGLKDSLKNSLYGENGFDSMFSLIKA